MSTLKRLFGWLNHYDRKIIQWKQKRRSNDQKLEFNCTENGIKWNQMIGRPPSMIIEQASTKINGLQQVLFGRAADCRAWLTTLSADFVLRILAAVWKRRAESGMTGKSRENDCDNNNCHNQANDWKINFYCLCVLSFFIILDARKGSRFNFMRKTLFTFVIAWNQLIRSKSNRLLESKQTDHDSDVWSHKAAYLSKPPNSIEAVWFGRIFIKRLYC